ncbi:MAG TPA: hypothetical protein VGE29_06585 [Prosthecobacter sp.]
MNAEELDTVLERFVSAVCPIFVRASSGVVHALGSGVFVAVSGHKFLLTAAHVTDSAATGDLLVPGPERLIYLQGFHASGRMPTSGDRMDDVLDIAYFRLKDSFATQLNSFFTFLDLEDLDLFDTTKPGDVYSMIGFPGGESSAAGEPLSRERFSFTADSREAKFYRRHGYNIEHHVLLHFHPMKIKQLGAPSYFGRRRQDSAPDPGGMSGCAVVSLSKSGSLQGVPSFGKLAGILTTYHRSEHSFAATRINCFIHCILKNHPEISVSYAGGFTHNRQR